MNWRPRKEIIRNFLYNMWKSESINQFPSGSWWHFHNKSETIIGKAPFAPSLCQKVSSGSEPGVGKMSLESAKPRLRLYCDPTHLDAVERSHAHVEEDAVEHRHGDELEDRTKRSLSGLGRNLQRTVGFGWAAGPSRGKCSVRRRWQEASCQFGKFKTVRSRNAVVSQVAACQTLKNTL